MKRIKISILIFLFSFLSNIYGNQSTRVNFNNENLEYEIVYHWGLIWKTVAKANLSSHLDDDTFKIKMVAKTIPFADKIYRVRDTLYSEVLKNNFRPLFYSKTSHEDNYSRKDIIRFSHEDDKTHAKTLVHRQGRESQSFNLSTQGEAFDLLSIFYRLRLLNLANMKVNDRFVTTVFSGKTKETLRVKYNGVQTIKLRNKKEVEAYYLTFNFSDSKSQKSSDDINVWISKDARQIPVMVVGKIKIGEIRCYYMGDN